MFAVVRHPDITAPGVIPAAALELHRIKGWVRVSDLRAAPSDFHLDDFAGDYDDLDAEPDPAPKAHAKTKAATTKESSA